MKAAQGDSPEPVEPSYKQLIRAIQQLNDECEKTRLNSNLYVVQVKAASLEQCKALGISPYCEDPELSLGNLGVTYNAIKVPKDTSWLPDDVRQRLLDLAMKDSFGVYS